MLRGSVLARSLRGKPFTLDLRGSPGYGCEAHPGLIGAPAGVVWAALGLVGVVAGGIETALGAVGVFAGAAEAASASAGTVIGAVEAALGAATPSWLGGVKQNSSEAKPLSCEHLVGVRRFELLTSSVSGKRSPPELNARSRVRECAGNNITELPPGGKNYFKKLVICGPIGARRSANSTRKVPFVYSVSCTFA